VEWAFLSNRVWRSFFGAVCDSDLVAGLP